MILPDDCPNSFYHCLDDGNGGWILEHFTCPSGAVFDPNRNTCVWPELVNIIYNIRNIRIVDARHHPIYVMDLLRSLQGLQQMLPLTPGTRRLCVTGNNGHSSGMVAGRWTLRKSTQTSALISTMAGLLWINIILLLSQKVHGNPNNTD